MTSRIDFGAQAQQIQSQAKALVMGVIGTLAQQATDKYSDIIDIGGHPDIDQVAADVADISWLVATPAMRALVALAFADAPYAHRHAGSAFNARIKDEAEMTIYGLIIDNAIYRRRVGLDADATMRVAA